MWSIQISTKIYAVYIQTQEWKVHVLGIFLIRAEMYSWCVCVSVCVNVLTKHCRLLRLGTVSNIDALMGFVAKSLQSFTILSLLDEFCSVGPLKGSVRWLERGQCFPIQDDNDSVSVCSEERERKTSHCQDQADGESTTCMQLLFKVLSLLF